MDLYLKTPYPSGPPNYSGNPYMAGLPYLQLVFARELDRGYLVDVAESELHCIDGLIESNGPQLSQDATWRMTSWVMDGYAELLEPGGLYEPSALAAYEAPVLSPEPSSLALLISGLLGVLFYARSRWKRR